MSLLPTKKVWMIAPRGRKLKGAGDVIVVVCVSKIAL